MRVSGSAVVFVAVAEDRCCTAFPFVLPRFGDGYKLSLSLVDDAAFTLHKTRTFVTGTLCPGAVETSCQGNSITYMLPRQGVDVAGLFQTLEASKASVGVREWGVTQTSLEEVFVKVVERAEAECDQPAGSGAAV